MNIVLSEIQSLTVDLQTAPSADQSGSGTFSLMYQQGLAEGFAGEEQVVEFKEYLENYREQGGSQERLSGPQLAQGWLEYLAGDSITVSTDTDVAIGQAAEAGNSLQIVLSGTGMSASVASENLLANGETLPVAGNGLPSETAQPNNPGLIAPVTTESAEFVTTVAANSAPHSALAIVDIPAQREQVSEAKPLSNPPATSRSLLANEATGKEPVANDLVSAREPGQAATVSARNSLAIELPVGRSTLMENTAKSAPFEKRTAEDTGVSIETLSKAKPHSIPLPMPGQNGKPADTGLAALAPDNDIPRANPVSRDPLSQQVTRQGDSTLAAIPTATIDQRDIQHLLSPTVKAMPESAREGSNLQLAEYSAQLPFVTTQQQVLNNSVLGITPGTQAAVTLANPAGANPATIPLPDQLQTLSLAPSADAVKWGQGIGERVSWMIDQKQNLATIRLDPPTLGKLDIQIRLGDDATNVTILTQHAQTRELIDSASLRLREFLQESGYQNVNVDVSQRQEQQQAKSQTSSDNSHDQAEVFNSDTEIESNQDQQQYFTGDGLVDTFA